MTVTAPYRLTACAALALVLGLAGCSGRDTEDSEKLAAINAAVERSEKAADRAEAALAKMRTPEAVVTEEAEPEIDSTEPDEEPSPDPGKPDA